MSETHLTWNERSSDSCFIASVWASSTSLVASRTAIADPCTSIALTTHEGIRQVVLIGPTTQPRQMFFAPGDTCMAIRLQPGVCLRDYPVSKLTNQSLMLPTDSGLGFWLAGTYWQFPGFAEAEQLVDQLHARGYLRYIAPPNDWSELTEQLSPRTLARRFRRLTGLSPYQLYQLQRMHQALRLLKQGMAAAEVASELAFVDQPHFTRATRQFLGHTPKKLAHLPQLP